MGLVGVADEDRVLHLAAHLAPGADGGVLVNLGAHLYLRVVAEGYGAAQAGAFHDLGTGADVDGPRAHVYHAALDVACLGMDVQPRRVTDDGDGVRRRAERPPRRQLVEIAPQHLAVAQEDVVSHVDGRYLTVIVAAYRAIAASGNQPFAPVERLAAAKAFDGLDQRPVGQNVTGYVKGFAVDGLTHGVFGSKVFGCAVAVFGRQMPMPFLRDGVDAHPQAGHRPRIGERQQIARRLGRIKKYDFHIIGLCDANVVNLHHIKHRQDEIYSTRYSGLVAD